MKTYKGFFKPKNPNKYKGDSSNIIYRSRWELKYMMGLDHSKDVISWGSEEVVIPYRSPIDGKIHRYFTDFIVVKINSQGIKETFIIEIKPSKQTKPPKIQTKLTRQYITEVKTWGVNEAKWKAATAYCMEKGWIFQILTEKELGIKF
jgi:hypothetical protein